MLNSKIINMQSEHMNINDEQQFSSRKTSLTNSENARTQNSFVKQPFEKASSKRILSSLNNGNYRTNDLQS